MAKQTSMPSLSLFNYTPSYFVPTASSNPDLSGRDGTSDLEEGAQHGAGSDGSVGMMSPVPGSTSWESDLSEIELVKGAEGLGFSLLDFAVSVRSEAMLTLLFIKTVGHLNLVKRSFMPI